MTVTEHPKDRDALTMTVKSEFDAPVERVWQLWSNPRQLERWWGPPTYPATVVDHDLSAGGRVSYYMTGPDGDRSHGWWRVIAVDAPSSLEFEDGFADSEGNPNHGPPDDDGPGDPGRAAGRGHVDGDRLDVPVRCGDGPDDRDGPGGGIRCGVRADRRPARRLIERRLGPAQRIFVAGGCAA